MQYKTAHSRYLDGRKDLIGSFHAAAARVFGTEKHQLTKLFSATPALALLSGETASPDFWRGKVEATSAVILTDEFVPEDEDLVPPDRLGYCMTLFSYAGLERKLRSFDLADRDIEEIMARVNDMPRNGHEICPLVVLLRNRIEEFCDKTALDFETVARVVLWHELGHVVFNPNIEGLKLATRLLAPHATPGKNYRRAKAFQFLVEGAAVWFSVHAENWERPVLDALFNLDEKDETDEYSYVTALDALHPVDLYRILLPFAFGCTSISLRSLPVKPSSGNPKLTPEDFVAPDQGMLYTDLAGFSDRLALATGTKLGLSDLIMLEGLFPELHDERTLDPALVSALQLTGDLGSRATNAVIRIDPPFFARSSRTSPSWSFDAFMMPRSHKGNESAEPGSPPLSIGVRYQGMRTSVLALDTVAGSGQVARYVAYAVDHQGAGQILIWGSATQWTEPILPRTAWRVHFSQKG